MKNKTTKSTAAGLILTLLFWQSTIPVHAVPFDPPEQEQGGGEGEASATSSSSSTSGSTASGAAGGHRGANTQTLRVGLLRVLEKYFVFTDAQRERIRNGSYDVSSNIPNNIRLLTGLVDPRLRDVICTAQTMIARHVDFAKSTPLIATIIANVFNEDVSAVHTALKRQGFCSGSSAAKNSETIVASEAQRYYTFLVDEEGIPLSSNLIWNACIRNTVVLNPYGKPYRCRRDDYRSRNRWYHPDIPMLEFTWNPRDPRGIALPENVAVLTVRNIALAQ